MWTRPLGDVRDAVTCRRLVAGGRGSDTPRLFTLRMSARDPSKSAAAHDYLYCRGSPRVGHLVGDAFMVVAQQRQALELGALAGNRDHAVELRRHHVQHEGRSVKLGETCSRSAPATPFASRRARRAPAATTGGSAPPCSWSPGVRRTCGRRACRIRACGGARADHRGNGRSGWVTLPERAARRGVRAADRPAPGLRGQARARP